MQCGYMKLKTIYFLPSLRVKNRKPPFFVGFSLFTMKTKNESNQISHNIHRTFNIKLQAIKPNTFLPSAQCINRIHLLFGDGR